MQKLREMMCVPPEYKLTVNDVNSEKQVAVQYEIFTISCMHHSENIG